MVWTAFGEMRRWHRRVFGQPALLLTGNGVWAATGPDRAEGLREWEAYSGPTERGRQAARLLTGSMRPTGARTLLNDGFVGLRTLSHYYLLARDGEGAYVAARSSLPVRLSDRAIYAELCEVVECLREEMGGKRLNAGENS